jgi:purine-binding chemotaxis protein CheW
MQGTAMTETSPQLTDRASQMRRAFDRAFAEPIRTDTTEEEDLLGIRLGDQACAIRISQIAGVHAGKKVTRVPGSHSALWGIAGFRGSLLPVYDLQLLLGYARAEAPRWLAIAAAAPIALAFATFDGRLRVSRREILPQTMQTDGTQYARDVVRTANAIRPILHLPSILEALSVAGTKAHSQRSERK